MKRFVLIILSSAFALSCQFAFAQSHPPGHIAPTDTVVHPNANTLRSPRYDRIGPPLADRSRGDLAPRNVRGGRPRPHHAGRRPPRARRLNYPPRRVHPAN